MKHEGDVCGQCFRHYAQVWCSLGVLTAPVTRPSSSSTGFCKPSPTHSSSNLTFDNTPPRFVKNLATQLLSYSSSNFFNDMIQHFSVCSMT